MEQKDEHIEFNLQEDEQAKEIVHLKRVVAGLKGHNRALQRTNELLKKAVKHKDEDILRKAEFLKEANKRIKNLQGEVDRMKALEAARSQGNGLKRPFTRFLMWIGIG